MRRHISYLVVATMVLTALPTGARANPVACETLQATRSGSDVLLTLEFDKICYYESPDATAIASLIVLRDLFEVPLELIPGETELYFTYSATDMDVSANSHRYEITWEDAEPGYFSTARAEVSGTDCALLEGTLEGGQADLALRLVRDCFATPLPTLEYRVRRNYYPVELVWSEAEGPDEVLCTAVDDEADDYHSSYEVGVRSGGESCNALLVLYEEQPPLDAGVVDATVRLDAGHDFDGDGVGCGCRGSGSPHGLWLLLCGVLLGLWRRRRP